MVVSKRYNIILPLLIGFIIVCVLFMTLPFHTAYALGPSLKVSGATPAALNANYNDTGNPTGGKAYYLAAGGESNIYYDGSKWCLKNQYWDYYYSSSTNPSDSSIPPSGGWKNMDGSSASISVSYGPTISFDETSVSVNEANGSVSLRVNLGSFDYSTTINYSTHDGSAFSGSDYNGADNSSVFVNGGTAYIYISIGIINDTKYEGNETFTVTLSSPSGAPIVSGTCTVTIISDDPQAKGGFSSGTPSVAENAGSISIPVTLDKAAESDVTIHYATSNGTASSGSDYTAVSGDLAILAGETSGSISVPILNDSIYEGNETFTVTLSSPVNAELSTASTTVTVTDDENAPVISFDPLSITANESTAAVTLIATISVPCQNAVTAQYATANGSASSGTDYTAKSGTLSFPANSATMALDITLLDDSIYEGDETFAVTLTSPSVGTLGAATASVTLSDNEPMPQLSLDKDVLTYDEDDGKAELTVTLSGPTQYGAAIQVTTSDGTAQAGQDYTGKSEIFTIPGGSTSGVIEIPIIDDNIYEGADESFTVTLSSPQRATLGQSKTTVYILDNDSIPEVGFASATFTQNENAGTALLTVGLTHPSRTDITVNYATLDGTANAGTDYTATAGTLTIPAFSTSQTIAIPLLNDSVYEGSENFTVTLSSPTGASLQAAVATVTIADDETVPAVGFAPAAVSAAENAGSATLTVTLTGASKTDITVDYSTANGTAIQDSDYTEKSGTITIPAGSVTATLNIPLLNDNVYEADETFTVTLSNPQGAALGIKTATVTITDDETVPKLSFTPATLAVHEGAGTATLTVTLSSETQNAVTVQYATQDGTAFGGSDYTAKTGTVTIPAGSSAATVEITIKEDALYEGAEAFTVVLSSPSGAAIDAGTATVQINDNESMPQASFDPAAISVNENVLAASLTVKLSGPSQADVTVQYATQDGTATAGSDYVASSGTLTIPGGTVSCTVDITLTDDTVYEGGESFTVLLSSPHGAVLGISSATVNLTDNEPAPVIGFDPAKVTFAEDAGLARLTITQSSVSQADTSVQYLAQNGTATSGADFTASSGKLTIVAGSTSTTVDIPLTDDTLYEGEEKFTVLLSSPTGAVLGTDTATVTITDTETKPVIGFNPLTASYEQDENAGMAGADVILSGASQADVSVKFTTVSGTAKPGSDYTGASGTLVIPGGSTTGRIEILLNNDSIYEGNETFTVKLSSPSGATLGTDTALFLIKDDEGYPQADFAQSTFETGEGDGKIRLTVNLTCASQEDIRIEYATEDGTAMAGKDYAAKSGTLLIPAGNTSGSVEITLKEDAIYEGSETITVTLTVPSGAGVTLGLSSATVLIGDNEGIPLVSFDPATITRNENAGTATLTAKLSGVSKTDTTMQYTTLDGTAKAGTDYVLKAGTLTIPAGSTTGTVGIAILDDSVYENGEDFSVVLSNPSGAVIGDSTATVHITDNDKAPLIGFEAPSIHVSEALAQAEITVRLSDASGAETSVVFNTKDDTALSGYDYTGQTGTLVIPAGSLSATIIIPLKMDEVYEGSETFTVLLSSPSGASLSAGNVTVILDDSQTPPVIVFTPAAVSVRESAGEASLKVTLSHMSSKDVTVQYETIDKTARAGTDYRTASGTLTIPAMSLTGTIKVRILNDAEYENTESFLVKLSGAAGGTIGTEEATVTIVDNDPKPTPTPPPAHDLNSTPSSTPSSTPLPTATVTPAPAAAVDPSRYLDIPQEAVAALLVGDETSGQAATIVSVIQQAVEEVIDTARDAAHQAVEATMLRFPDIQPLQANSPMKLELPSAQMQSAAQAGLGVTVRMENITFEVPPVVLNQAAEGSTSMSLECRTAEEAAPSFRIDGGSGAFIGPAYQYALAVVRPDGETGYVDTFNEPVTITVHMTAEQASAIKDPAKVTMCYINPVTGKTDSLPTVYDPETLTLTFTTTYFAEAAEEQLIKP